MCAGEELRKYEGDRERRRDSLLDGERKPCRDSLARMILGDLERDRRGESDLCTITTRGDLDRDRRSQCMT